MPWRYGFAPFGDRGGSGGHAARSCEAIPSPKFAMAETTLPWASHGPLLRAGRRTCPCRRSGGAGRARRARLGTHPQKTQSAIKDELEIYGDIRLCDKFVIDAAHAR